MSDQSEPELAAAGREDAQHGREDAAMGRLAQAAAMSELASAVDDLAGSVREDRVWRRRFFVALITLGAVVCISAAGTWLNYTNLDIVRDTVDPGGRRFQRNAANTATVVDQLVTDAELDRVAKQITDCMLGRGKCP